VDVPQDYVEAVKWFRQSADQGLPAAQYMLGAMYGLGQGVPLDLVRSHMWLNLSGAQGNQVAMELRDTIAKRMTTAQIAEAQRLAGEWKPLSASR
jgi:TPR repeat protein